MRSTLENLLNTSRYGLLRVCGGVGLVALLLVPGTGLAQSYSSGTDFAASPYQMRQKGGEAYRLIDPNHRPSSPPHLSQLPFATEIEAAARISSLDPALVHALIAVESGHRQDAVSPKGAVGLMQLMPGTANRYGVKEPGKSSGQNLLAGTRYLRDLLNIFDSRLDLALAAYNAGEGAVQKYGNRIPPYRETRNYVPSVLEKYDEWRQPDPAKKQSVVYLPGTQLNTSVLREFLSRGQ